MSEIEDATTTVARLLKKSLRVVKDDGGLANIAVTGEWQTADAFKDADGQVTVGLAETTDQKLELSGKTRRRLSVLRVNVWTTEQLGAVESARAMRSKIAEEVNRVVRLNRGNPNVTVYDFYNTGPATQTQKAYFGTSEASPSTAASWTELSSEEYAALWTNDGNLCEVSASEAGEYAAALFGFKVESRKNTFQKMVLVFEGQGSGGSGSGVVVKAWNNIDAVWGNAQSSTEGPATITLTQNLPNYINDEGYVWFLARTSGPSDGENPATLQCDYASCTVTVKGVTYCDIVSYRQADRVDVKPFIFRTEFTVKSWFFETLGG